MSTLEGYVEGMINLGGGGGGGSNVVIEPTLETGTKIADFTIDETSGELYAPTPETYTAGNNIDITNNEISATYTAGDGINIENGVISATSTGGDVFEYKPSYILFRNGGKYNHIETYLPQLDWEYYIDFYINEYQNDKAIIGNNQQASRIHLTMYSNKWYSATGSDEFSFGDSSMITGRHNFTWNRIGDRKILFDGVEVGTTNGYIDTNLSIRLNDRTDGMACSNSRIYEFRIKNPSGDIIHDFKPFSIYKNGVLIDKRIIDLVGGMVLNVGYYEIIEIEE